jgi:nucleotide-binding universal stress UspA family protein
MKILVPVDGSPASIRAVRLAIEHVKALPAEASLILVNVQNFSTLGLPEGTEIMPSAWIQQKEESAASDALKGAVAACREAGINYVTRAERGGVATIDRVAREEQVQHIFMGTRGLGGVRGLLLGSVATQLLHLVDVPVTLVK